MIFKNILLWSTRPTLRTSVCVDYFTHTLKLPTRHENRM